MRSHRFQRWLAVAAMLALPMMASAQEATLSGTVSDTTGGALPGVTVRALHTASGNSFEAVTDERGGYRMPVRVGAFRVTAELSGFAPVTRTLTVLVGQEAVVNLQMGVSGVQESVTVTGEAPLLDVTQSRLGGNIDPRQLQELPVNGRNWMELTMLAPGARGNAVVDVPFNLNSPGSNLGVFNLNMDGQQITFMQSISENDGQPRFSRDAIAEFEFVSSRFDATQGRSSGVQVNAISKSGTNTPSGSFSGYFRDDSLNAADAAAKKVLPYQDQQLSWTFGGPIRKDKLHIFGNFEYERNPVTYRFSTRYPSFNQEVSALNVEKKGGVKLDAQFSPRTRLMVRGTGFKFQKPTNRTGGDDISSQSPSFARGAGRETYQLLAKLTQVLSNQAVNEINGGASTYLTIDTFDIKNLRLPSGKLAPQLLFAGFSAGRANSNPDRQGQDVYSVRDDFTYSLTKGGRHTFKLGAEYLHQNMNDLRCLPCGQLDLGSPPANLPDLLPNQYDASTWNLAPLSSIAIRYREAFGSLPSYIRRKTFATWLQDDLTVTSRLTLNLGLRYDLETNLWGQENIGTALEPWMPANRPNDKNNVGPRLGASFSLNDRTVVRGGYGIYFGSAIDPHGVVYYSHRISILAPNDGRADFASNPFNGPDPTYESLQARLCTPTRTPAVDPGCIVREILNTGRGITHPDFNVPYSHQSSIGLQRQVGTNMAIEADYVYFHMPNNPAEVYNANLTYDPVTGANYPFSDVTKRAIPGWGAVSMTVPGSLVNSHALQTAFTKRFSNNWQASGTYTLSGLWDKLPQPYSGLTVVPFPVRRDLGNEYTLAVGDQRHRATVNGIWQLRYGFQLSGLYFFGSGFRYPTTYGSDVAGRGVPQGERRLRPDGSIVPRNNFVGNQIHRVDLRLQRRFPLGLGRAGIDGLLELYNVFNHANYGTYGGLGPSLGGGGAAGELASNYGKPVQNTNPAYLPRVLQLGFRFAF